MNLLKVLLISWAAGFSLSFLKALEFSYQSKCLTMSLIYFILAIYCYKYLAKELTLKRVISAYVIASLCGCMIVSSWFNFVFVNPDIYHALIDIRRGDGLTWENIYNTIELTALLIVGRDGLIYLYNWLICRNRWINVIIANNSTYNLGR